MDNPALENAITWSASRAKAWRKRRIFSWGLVSGFFVMALISAYHGEASAVVFELLFALFNWFYGVRLAAKSERDCRSWNEQWIRMKKDPENMRYYLENFR